MTEARLVRKIKDRLLTIPGVAKTYQFFKPLPEVRITRYLETGRALMAQYGLTDVTITREGGWFRSPWGAEFLYAPRWGAYGAERAELHERVELEHCARLIRRNGVVIDVGANLGAFTVNLAVRRPDLHFHSLEPVTATCDWLRANIRRNGLGERVHAHRLAAAERAGALEITNRSYTDNHLVVGEGGAQGTEVVPVITLDEFTAEHGVQGIDLIKADVEGAELRVLRGAERLLREERPHLLLEVIEEHLNRFDGSIEALEAFLSAHEYTSVPLEDLLPHNRFYVHRARLDELGV